MFLRGDFVLFGSYFGGVYTMFIDGLGRVIKSDFISGVLARVIVMGGDFRICGVSGAFGYIF